jgi:hypothetical protein
MLNGFLNDPAQEVPRTAEVRALASKPFTGGNVILVTHMTNIRAATALSVVSGEMVVLSPTDTGTFKIAGRIVPPAFTTAQ